MFFKTSCNSFVCILSSLLRLGHALNLEQSAHWDPIYLVEKGCCKSYAKLGRYDGDAPLPPPVLLVEGVDAGHCVMVVALREALLPAAAKVTVGQRLVEVSQLTLLIHVQLPHLRRK